MVIEGESLGRECLKVLHNLKDFCTKLYSGEGPGSPRRRTETAKISALRKGFEESGGLGRRWFKGVEEA